MILGIIGLFIGVWIAYFNPKEWFAKLLLPTLLGIAIAGIIGNTTNPHSSDIGQSKIIPFFGDKNQYFLQANSGGESTTVVLLQDPKVSTFELYNNEVQFVIGAPSITSHCKNPIVWGPFMINFNPSKCYWVISSPQKSI